MSGHEAFKATTLRELTAALRRMETQGGRKTATLPAAVLSRTSEHERAGFDAISTGLPSLDALLAGGGLRRGTCVEWLSEGPGTGVERLALEVVPHALRPGGVCLIVDPRREFFPRGAVAMGLDLNRLVVLRPQHPEEALWGTEQALRCPAVNAVVAWNELVPSGRQHDRIFRRLQLAAEEGQSLGVFLRPGEAQRRACWGDLRVLVSPRGGKSLPTVAGVDLTLLHCRGRVPGDVLTLERDHETGVVRVVSRLADPASASGAAGA